MFSGVGYVREEDRDGIGQCADYLLHREGIDTVIVYGVVGGEFVDGSLRTKSHTLDPDKWIKMFLVKINMVYITVVAEKIKEDSKFLWEFLVSAPIESFFGF